MLPIADEIKSTMVRFGYVIREEDPFSDKYEFVRDLSPYATRIRLMWKSMRDAVLTVKPSVPAGINIEAYMKDVEDRYKIDAYHSLSIEGYKVSEELIDWFNIPDGNFDTVAECRYEVPSATSIGMLYQGLVLSTMKNDDAAQAIIDVFSSFITDEISDFNSNVYYTNPDYLRCSYLEGKMLA